MPAAERAERYLDDLRGLLLGFDRPAAGRHPADRRRLLAGYLAARAELGGQLLPGEVELLTVFADLSELSRNRPARDAGEPDSDAADLAAGQNGFPGWGPCTARASTSTATCRASTSSGPACPRTSRPGCGGCSATTGSASLDRTPELEAAVFRVFLAQQRMAADAGVVSELLRQWLASAPPAEPLRERAGLALEHLIEATQVRFPATSDLARGVVFRWFAQPLLRRNRARVYAAVRADLRYLDQHPDAPDRAERIQAMVASSEPLVRLLGQRIGRAPAGTRRCSRC